VLSFLKRKDSPTPASAVDEAATVQAARTRARRRLIGAAALVGVGIIGFPLLFETQPRPIAVDIPIEIPARESAPPLKPPPPKPAAATPRAAGPVVAETAADAPAGPPQAASVPASPPPSDASSAPAPRAERTAGASAPAAASAALARPPAPPAEASREAQRAQALLDGKPLAAAEPSSAAASAPRSGRFVVQAGAYTDSAALREARQKVEKLGLKTYTQVIETESGSRTRVRVGPFDTREEAEKAATRIKGSGLAVSILSL
jgi:DedD protein